MTGALSLASYSDLGIEWMAQRVPGWNPSSRLERLDRNCQALGLPDEVMVELYLQIEEPTCPYIPNVFDCENFSRYYAARVAELWGRLVSKGRVPEKCILAHGAIFGRIPAGEGAVSNHAECFFFNDRNEFRMFDPQTRLLVSRESVARIEQVWTLEMH